MTGKDPVAHPGLPWPKDYADLLPVIREAWEIDGSIYLNRKLSGRSGAKVYAADITSSEFTGQAILKLDHSPDPEKREESEAERHRQALAANPDYGAKHLPKIVHSLHHEDSLAILSTIAARGLEYSKPWNDGPYHRGLNSVRQLSRDLLEDWNRDYELAQGMHAPRDLLNRWLDYRLDPQAGRIHDFLLETCGLSPREASISFEGHWYPNPLAFATSGAALPDKLQLRPVLGSIHGDLHGTNVLVEARGSGEGRYYLIDLAFYQRRQFLFIDHANFELSYLLHARDWAEASNWDSILNHLSYFNHRNEQSSLRGDDLGLIELVGALRQEQKDWVERHESNRLSYMENQILLARVAAGLGFVHKRLASDARLMAFIYAAFALKDYLRLNGVDWPKHGPAVIIEKPSANEASPSRIDVTASAVDGATSFRPAPVPAKAKHPPLPDVPAIAVMPFENLSGDSSQEFLADGITEEIITELSHVDWVMVISRGSTFAYKGHAVDTKQVGRELGVHCVVEGSVRKSGDRVRITAQLTDAIDGHSIWAERFDRHMDDLFVLQDEIAQSIAGSIDSELKSVQREEARRRHPPFNAWERLQKGLWHFFRRTQEDTDIAREEMLQALSLDPAMSAAHASLALIESRTVLMGKAEDPKKVLEGALAHATKAVSLDENNSFAHTVLSRIYFLLGSHQKAIGESQLSLRLNPSSSMGHAIYGCALVWSGRPEEAIDQLDRSIRLSPKDPFVHMKQLGKSLCHLFLGNLAEAESLARDAMQGHIIAPYCYAYLGAIMIEQGRLEDAHAAVSKARRLDPALTISRFHETLETMVARQRDLVLDNLRKAGLPE